MASPGRVDSLVREANNPSEYSRHCEVLRELAASDDPRAFAPLFKSLVYAKELGLGDGLTSRAHFDPGHLISQTALDALVRHGSEAMAVFALKQVDNMPEDADSWPAFQLACKIGGRRLFKELITALRARELHELRLSQIMRELVMNLRPDGGPGGKKWTRDDREWLRLELEELVLGDRDRAVRTASVFGLEYLRDPASVATLLKATKDDQPMVRTTALEALAKLPDGVVRGGQIPDA